MSSSICRWGILGTAGIACKNWQALYHAENAQVVAVGSRRPERAAEWIAANQAEYPFDPAPRACSYEDLVSAEDIDALYLPLPTGLRREWVLKAAGAGKHVLAEKPAGVDASEVEEILAACERNGVQYMDGVMFMHSTRLQALRAQLDDPERMGSLRRIATQFSFLAPEEFLAGDIRLDSRLEPLGCLGDLGWYSLRFTLWAMNYLMPEAVSGRMLKAIRRDDRAEDVPVEFSGELFFPGGVSASFYCSFITEHQQWAHLSGTAGYLYLDDFVLPWKGDELRFAWNRPHFDVQGCEFNMENHTEWRSVAEPGNSHPRAQESNLFRECSRLALSGRPDPHWGRIALQTQRLLDACLESARNGGALVTLPA